MITYQSPPNIKIIVIFTVNKNDRHIVMIYDIAIGLILSFTIHYSNIIKEVIFWAVLLKREEKKCVSINIENSLQKQGIRDARANKG
ncbi:hypothetical protein MTBBW1_830006 [Desulfamplus magnetovallimortis]|uniref:Uncharacterized protein n=1 Tax=Desulfamplus magnetovallimortis TaxID=1246637 RepID=A0A1W1HKC9_9BACT|nr:hypothetical protein MTBBW1_830006 [Desulfamplus magnetovallimortis]